MEDYIDIVRRYRSWIIGPLFAGLVLSVVVAFLWPDTFVSSALMRITPPQVPERLVPSSINLQIGERLAAMQTEITSRGSLSDLIQHPALDLYRKQRTRQPLEDVIEMMRKDIKIFIIDNATRPNPNRIASAFQISFRYTDRYKAQAVVRNLVTKFMDQNVAVQRNQSSFTTSFLGNELMVAKQNLERVDQELTQFRMQNAGRLPEQLATNLSTLSALQQQLSAVADGLNRNAQEKMMLENTLQNVKHQLNFVEGTIEESAVALAQKNERLTQLNRVILDTETRLAAALESLREDHPDIRSMKAQLNVLKRERDGLEKQEQARAEGPKAVEKRRNPQAAKSVEDFKGYISAIEAQIRIKDLDMQDKVRRQTELHKDIEACQSRINTSPINEQKYLALQREYQLAKQRYEELSQRKAISETAGKLEEQKAGENLEVVDSPSLPEQPTDPQRIVIAAIGVGVGLMFGVFLAGAKEMKDTSLKNLKDVRAYTNLAVLSSIPLLENALLVRRKRRLFWLAWSTAVIVGLIAMTGSMYYYYFGHA